MVHVANSLAGAQADAVTTAVDGGSGAGTIKIYDGSIPADASVAITTQNLLAEPVLNDPSFAGYADATPGAVIVLDVTPEPEDSSADATGTPTFARMCDSDGNVIVQFDTVGVGSGELQVNAVPFQAGAKVTVTAGSFTVPES